jgi:hypothetical protein
MNNKRLWIYMLVVGALAIATAGGIAAYRTATAASQPVGITQGQNFAQDQSNRGGPGKGMGGSSNADLAKALGITEDQLNAAYQKANTAALAQAVKDGLITQAQADEITKQGQAFPLGGRGMGFLSQKGVDYDTYLAQALGITTDKLQAARVQAENARIDQAVTDGKLTQDQADLMKGRQALYADKTFQASMQSAFEAAVKAAVTSGVITQAQADQILKDGPTMGMQGGKGLGFDGFPGGDGGHGRGGFDRQNGNGQQGGKNNGSQTYPAPATTPAPGF